MQHPPAPPTPRDSPSEVFLASVQGSLRLAGGFQPMPDAEDDRSATVRAMQRARRTTWQHAGHSLGWSMFESIRISVRLAEAFAEWTRAGGGDVESLGAELERVEVEARNPEPISLQVAFVDQLIELSAIPQADEWPLMEYSLEAYRRTRRALLRAAG
ncbi:MAG TPA: hypothetical protein VEX86_20950 [Longimicrobium sp.]|nr:hypothetical protein [Longimicrobium sp.]